MTEFDSELEQIPFREEEDLTKLSETELNERLNGNENLKLFGVATTMIGITTTLGSLATKHLTDNRIVEEGSNVEFAFGLTAAAFGAIMVGGARTLSAPIFKEIQRRSKKTTSGHNR